jgi:hypothetical protein
LPPGNYALTIASRMKNALVNLDVKTEQSFDVGAQPTYVPVIGYAKAVFERHASADPEVVQLAPYLTSGAANTLVIGARMLDAADNGLTEGYITVTTRDPFYNTIYCDEPPPGVLDPSISYASTNFATKTSIVCLGRRNFSVPSDTWHKFVIAHEFGHVVQGLGMGNLTTSYDNQTPQPLCRCDHVQSSNQIHCLQSQERIGASQSEGFAHAYAAKLLNDTAGPDCGFGYYKEFMGPDNVVRQPPVAIDCKAQVKWLQNYCVAPDRGVEYDWLNFLYDINTSPASQRTTLPDLWQIYLGACSPPDCEVEDVKWIPLRDAAAVHYGLSTPKYARFIQSGSDFGVNH